MKEQSDSTSPTVIGTDPDRYMTRTRIAHKQTIGATPNKVKSIGLGKLHVTTHYGNV